MSSSEKSGAEVPTTTRFKSVRRASMLGGGVGFGVGELDKGFDKSLTVAVGWLQLQSRQHNAINKSVCRISLNRNFMDCSF